MIEYLQLAFESIRDFMELGGWVLYLIFGLLVVMWFMIVERTLYLYGDHKHMLNEAYEIWQSRSERHSCEAHQVRLRLISIVSTRLSGSIPLIKACVALSPLLGLLGTVTGMIEVFQVMAISGSGNVRGMAGGVSKATIPTMAGMVAALSGLFFSFWLQHVSQRERELLSERLTLD
jgi:biopolymer transport protein ExbB